MKVVHVGYEHRHQDARIMKKECKTLVEQGFDVTFVTSDKNGTPKTDEEAGVKFITVPLKNIRKVRFYIYMRDLFKVLVDLDADVYHIHEFVLCPLVKKLKKRGKIVIYDMHEMAVKQSEAGLIRKFGKAIGGTIVKKMIKQEREAIEYADYNITVTPSQVDYMKQYRDNVYLITNYPILQDNFEEPSYEGKDLCFAGQVSFHWNHEPILEAMTEVPEVKYELAGPATDAYIAKLKEIPSWDRVNYHGMIPFEEVSILQRNSMVGMALHLSDQVGKEGTLGNTKLFEYMGVGIPFICTNYTLWEDIVKKYDCGICVDPKNAVEIRDAIRYFLDNPERVKEMGLNGHRAAVEEYNWNTQAKVLLEIYNDIREKEM